MAYRGYHFRVGDLELPYAPSELTVTIGSKNETVELIDGNEINILKNPKLTEFKFDVELPRGRQYPFANKLVSAKTYTDYFEKLMLKKTPVKLVISRPNPFVKGQNFSSKTKVIVGGTSVDFESNEKTVTLEGYTLKESAENAYDVTVSLTFKEYIAYGTVKQVYVNTNTSSDSKKQAVQTATKHVEENDSYTIKKGDCLWNIARKFYGNGSKWTKIYDANKTVIENTAKKYGKKSSSNGHWIYPGCKLIIPKS